MLTPRPHPATLVLALFAWLALAPPLSAADAARFTRLQPLTNGEVSLRLDWPSGLLYRLDASTNLPQWASWISGASSGSVEQLDSAAPYHPTRFYRAVQFDSPNPTTGDHLPTSLGDAIIRTLHHASIIVRWADQMIYIDVTNQTTGLPPANLVLLTHGHADHLSASAITAWKTAAAPIVASAWAYNSLPPGLRGSTILLTNGQTTNLLGLQIDAVPMYNFSGNPTPKAQATATS